MKKQVTRYYILLLLATMFAAPGIAAYLFYQHPNWVSSTKTNKGTLLNPAVALDSLNNQSKWQIIFWSPGPCKKTCLKQLDTLARVRLALGRKLYQVDQQLILGDDRSSITEKIKSELKERDFHMGQLSVNDKIKLNAITADTKIFIANPDKFLILSYQSQVNPDDIYKDLKLLLSTTEKKSG
ncbi:hypothetical protein [Legionella maioricensis]|uniref:Transmembrane protein n=1 Tax=Legionella maioricensis TaxID=2896528 RepID=A0A9X2I9E2_9GAMM|nr:hypothetical protein [Legionella maioricensis]MCL9683284.1 hypothetical protein [Legionella maioricensis]MCL9686020.1 hypothetical protein [Legionella maioricensis]